LSNYLYPDWRSYFWESDAEKKETLKKEFLDVQVPNYLSKFEKIVEKSDGEFLLGKNYTWADLHIAHTLAFYEETVSTTVLDSYPNLKKFKDSVFEIPQVKKWVQERPQTPM
jgi:glutathione S-transferase